ncbi:MAG: NYN domain-containing protein [bacterium]|nr:NYN domain-containing protein [bacterium]
MRISVFVDGANFFFMQKQALGWFADPKLLLDYISKTGEIKDAFYYIGEDTPPEARHQAFINSLPRMGFSVVTKKIKTIYDQNSGIKKKKANLDIEIVLDMFNTIDHYDKAILVSGDGDFERALTLLRARGKEILVIATSSFLAHELRQIVGRHYIDLADIEDEIKKK